MPSPRHLAGLPAVDPRDVARAWLVRRIAAAPLPEAPGLASASFAARAPELCGALLASLADPAALEALTAQADVLRGLGAARAGSEGTPGDASAHPAGVRSASALVASTEQLRAAVLDVVAGATDPALHAALHDRLAHACARLLEGALEPGEVTVRDARAPVDPRGHLDAEAERLTAACLPFSLLAVEIEDAAVVPAGVLAAAETALRAALPAGALSVPDGPGSMLVLTSDADGALETRALHEAVGAAASHRGAPLRVAVGRADHPRDGTTLKLLLAQADRQLFAARAQGLALR